MIQIENKRNVVLEIFIGVIIVVILSAVFSLKFNEIKRGVRDAVRLEEIAVTQKALLIFINSSAAGVYPLSAGECLNADSLVIKNLFAADALAKVPSDPIWPAKQPLYLSRNGYVEPPAKNFCYYYYSNGRFYHLSYYLEDYNGGGVRVVTGMN